MPSMKPQRSIRAILALLLSLALLAGMLPVAALAQTVESVSVRSAPLTAKSSATDGMVRVFLSSLGYPTSLTLTIAGNYSINGLTSRSLSSGSTVTIGFSSSTGAITLTQNGQKTNMGTQFALRRHSATGTNGIKIAQAKEPGNAYPGDLSFEAVYQNGSYRLYTVAHIFIENYLYGVLPYEMGNSTNIEALKAQAVAARTYTVRMMNARASGRYDVVDTTNDQVYRGTPSGNANCVAAVNATKGIVLMYGSNYAMTYYSASNGGQTETAKNGVGGSNTDYLVVKDDPFDYTNPSCTVKSKTIYTNLTSSMNPSGLISLLKGKAVSKISGATNSNTTLQTLKSVTPHTPKYASPSRLYTKMDFTLVASVGGRSVTTTVTCDIFSELESLLSMSIQSNKNELWSVQSSSASFKLQARRYGHGVGMSQRGAMYMAKLGYTYDEILGFYYPGCKRVQHSFTNTILAAGSGSSQVTVEDPADLEEESGACKGTVKLVSASASISIRASKSTSGTILGTASNGAIMNVLSDDGSWCFVKYGELQGYLPTNALAISGTPSGDEGAVSSVSGFATVTANDYVNLRDSSSMSGRIVSTAPTGAVMSVFSRSGSWARVQYCATVAYVNTGYVSISGSYPSATVSTGSATATVLTEDGTGSVNLRASASMSAEVLRQVPSGTQVTVSSDDGSWSIVSYEGVTGYMLSSLLALDGESLEGGGSVEPDDTPSSTGAIISADIGYLRESPNANAASLMLIGQGEAVTVTQRDSEWCAVTYGDVSGYILTSSLGFSAGGEQSVATAVVTTASGSLNLRAEARAGSAVLTTIPRHAQVEITSIGATWCGVRYGGYSGYAMSSFLTISGQAGGTTEEPTEGDRAATVATQSGSLNLRVSARSGSEILRTIPQYAAVTVHEYGAEWCNVTYLGTTGYVMTVFLAFEPEDEGDAPDTGDEPDDETGSGGVWDESGNGDGTSDEEGTDGETETPDANDPEEPLVGDETDENTLYAVVATVSGSLNLRQDALPGSDVIGRIPKGTTIVIEEKLAAWSRTSYAGRTGYVMNAFLSFHQGQLVSDDAESATVTTASGSLNLRTEPSMNGGVVLRIPQYATVSVQQRGETWCYLAYGGSMGYAMTQYLTFATSAPQQSEEKQGGEDAEPEPETDEDDQTDDKAAGEIAEYTTAYVQTSSGSLNLREKPKSGAEIVKTIPRGAAVQVYEYGENWCQVVYGAYTGYVVTSFLRFDGNDSSIDYDVDATIPLNDSNNKTDDDDPPVETGDEAPASGIVLDPTLAKPEKRTFATVAPTDNDVSQALWTQCSEKSEIADWMPLGETVELLMIGEEWYLVQYNGLQGYCLVEALTVQAP